MTAIPRPASTVVLMDEMSRVYLTKRPKTMKFLGGFYVFPGGAVEGDDHVIDDKHLKTEGANESFNTSHYVAAARELFEEVGILLGSRDDGTPAKLETKAEREYRRQLINGDITFFQLLKQEGFTLKLDVLSYIGHIITPEINPIRFDTRFFLAKLPPEQTPNPDKHEIDEAMWISPEKALKAHENGDIPIPPPTVFCLESIQKFLDGGSLNMPEFHLKNHHLGFLK